MVLFVAVMVFALSTLSYGVTGTSPTVLGVLVRNGLVWYVYGYSVLCWYLTILMDKFLRQDTQFVDTVRAEESAVTDGLASRIREKS